jgi:hypothetical protein
MPHAGGRLSVAPAEIGVAGNPIQQMLDARGFPWRESQAALIERSGVGPDSWFNRDAVVFVDSDPPPIPGLLRPLHFEPAKDCDPKMPPLRLWGWAWTRKGSWWRSRAMKSLIMVRDSLEPALGRPGSNNSSNTRGWSWRRGPASIEIMCFPPRLAWSPTGDEIPDRRDPKVDASCWITLNTGFRPACTPRERAWLEAFEPAMALGGSGNPRRIAANQPMQDVLEFIREPVAGSEKVLGSIGRTADGEALIFASDQLYVVPVERVDHVEVSRVMPARGSGYASMTLACRGNFGERPIRRVLLGHRSDWEALDEPAARLAEWLELPCVLREPEFDD